MQKPSLKYQHCWFPNDLKLILSSTSSSLQCIALEYFQVLSPLFCCRPESVYFQILYEYTAPEFNSPAAHSGFLCS